MENITSAIPSPYKDDEVLFGTGSGLFCKGSFKDAFSNIEKFSMYYNPTDTEDEENESSGDKVLASEPVSSVAYSADKIWVLMDSFIFFMNEKRGDYLWIFLTGLLY